MPALLRRGYYVVDLHYVCIHLLQEVANVLVLHSKVRRDHAHQIHFNLGIAQRLCQHQAPRSVLALPHEQCNVCMLRCGIQVKRLVGWKAPLSRSLRHRLPKYPSSQLRSSKFRYFGCLCGLVLSLSPLLLGATLSIYSRIARQCSLLQQRPPKESKKL